MRKWKVDKRLFVLGLLSFSLLGYCNSIIAVNATELTGEKAIEQTQEASSAENMENIGVDALGSGTWFDMVPYEGATYQLFCKEYGEGLIVGSCSGYAKDGIVLPDNVVVIEDRAFRLNNRLEGKLILSNNLTTIGESAFFMSQEFSGDLIIPDGVTSIGEYAFSSCSGFDGKLRLSENLTRIEAYTFWGCENLKGDLVIPEEVGFIGERAFADCKNMDGKLYLPDRVRYIGELAFADCNSLQGNLNLPEQLREIGDTAFFNCSSLTGDLVIPGKVRIIGDGAFSACSGLSGNVYLPDSVSSIGKKVFGDREDITIYASRGSYGEYYADQNGYGYVEWEEEKVEQNPDYVLKTVHYTNSKFVTDILVDDNCRIMGDGDYHMYVWYGYDSVDPGRELSGLFRFLNEVENCTTNLLNGGNYKLASSCRMSNYKIPSNCCVTDIYSPVSSEILGLTPGKAVDYSLGYSTTMELVFAGEGINLPEMELAVMVVSPDGKKRGTYCLDADVETYSQEAVMNGIGLALEQAGKPNAYGKEQWLFKDVKKKSWYYPYVKYAYNTGLMKGKETAPSGYPVFDPEANMTRAEFVQTLYNKEGKKEVSYQPVFTDVADGKWYTNAIMWAYQNKIVSGKGNKFDINGQITRQEMATILYNYAANFKGYETTGRAELTGYTDAGSISKWAVDNMKWALNYGIMKGKGEKLAPLENASRAECATMLSNFMEVYN